MTRTRLLAAASVTLACLALQSGPGVAVADEGGSPAATPTGSGSASGSPSPGETTPSAGATGAAGASPSSSPASSSPAPSSPAPATQTTGPTTGPTSPTAVHPHARSAATGSPTTTPSSTKTATPTPEPVVRKVTLTAAHPLVALHHYSLHGTVRPVTSHPAVVTVQRLTSGHWRSYKKDTADSHGRYHVTFSTNHPQHPVFRAVATWRSGKKTTSTRLTRTVVAHVDVHVSGPLKRAAVPYSYRRGCPVTPKRLRRITINRFTYSHAVARGSLIVRAGAVPVVRHVFTAAFAKRFRVHSMRPTDAFYAHGHRTPTQSDIAAMRADNTSAFNCRPVTGNPYRVSQHSYGNAIDINTVRNPYVVGSRVYPSWAKTYLNRRKVRTGMITRSGVVATVMRHSGWPWGARWAHPDYQHFSSNGG